MSGFRENGQKSQKSDRAMFLTFFTPNSMPSLGKIFGAVSEIIRYGRTHAQNTQYWFYRTPLGSQPGTNNYLSSYMYLQCNDYITQFIKVLINKVWYFFFKMHFQFQYVGEISINRQLKLCYRPFVLRFYETSILNKF